MRLGLVDELGNMEQTIRVAAKLGGIEGKPQVIYPETKRKSLLRYLTKEIISVISDDLKSSNTGINYLYLGSQAS